MSKKVSPLSALLLMAVFGGSFATALVITMVWHFYAYGQPL